MMRLDDLDDISMSYIVDRMLNDLNGSAVGCASFNNDERTAALCNHIDLRWPCD